MAWNHYWEEGGFIDLTKSSNPNATELQRRIILSQYHVRVNSAANGQPPQESGLMNNGWYGESLSRLDLFYMFLMRSRQVPHGDGHLASRTFLGLGTSKVL